MTHQCTYLPERDQHCCQAQKKLHTALAGAALHGQSFREFCLSVLAGYNLDKSHEHGVFPSWKCLESKHQLWHISGEVFLDFSRDISGISLVSAFNPQLSSTFLKYGFWIQIPIVVFKIQKYFSAFRILSKYVKIWANLQASASTKIPQGQSDNAVQQSLAEKLTTLTPSRFVTEWTHRNGVSLMHHIKVTKGSSKTQMKCI